MTKRAEKRLKKKKTSVFTNNTNQDKTTEAVIKKKITNPFQKLYLEHYKIILIIPFIFLLLAIAQISYQTATTGDFINKDITLKGGISLTIEIGEIDIIDLQSHLALEGHITNVRNIYSGARVIGTIIESDLDISDDEGIDSLKESVRSYVPFENYSLEGVGAAISQSFFNQAMIALVFSFLLMGLIVTITFKSFIPSLAVIAAAFSDIIITIAIVNLFGLTFSTASLAALLMLIGYSVDTNILLTTRVLKRTEGTVLDRIASAFKTGILMSCTTLVAISIALFVASSGVIQQIMLILFIGILVDQMNTWAQNTGILRWYLEKKGNKE
ncbi:MAG: protein translocase subunit SecF [Candidatus Woesearchaeota archaeon]